MNRKSKMRHQEGWQNGKKMRGNFINDKKEKDLYSCQRYGRICKKYAKPS